MLAVVFRQLSRGQPSSFPFVGVRVHSWVFVSVRGPSCRVRVCSWASVPVRGPSCRVRVRSCPFVALVSRSCLLVGLRVAFMGVRVAFVSVGGRSYPLVGVPLGLTWMHDAQHGTSSSPCTGLVTWRRGVVLVCCGVAVCRGLCEVDGGRWGRWLWATGGAGCRGW